MQSNLPLWVPLLVLSLAILVGWVLDALDRRKARKNGTEWQGDRGLTRDSDGSGSGDGGGGDGGGDGGGGD